jgi:hypothetical protein
MQNGIVVIDLADIPAAMQVAATLPDYTIYVFDPVLVDKVAAHTSQVKLLAWDDCPDYAALEAWSHQAAFAMEARLDGAVREHAPEVSIASWQHLDLFYLLMKMKWYGGLWQALAGRLDGLKVHLLICDKASAYNYHSFIPALLLIEQLQQRGIEFSGFVYGAETDNNTRVPALAGSHAGAAGAVLTHLPTCFYDLGYFNGEMRASGKQFVNIKSKRYDLPVHTDTDIALVDFELALAAEAAPQQERLARFRGAAAAALEQALGEYLAMPRYRERQSAHIADIYAAQLLTYWQLERHFDAALPAKLLLSDRDMGLHGPLIAFARDHHLPVLLLPHSKTTNDMEYDYPNMVSLSHPIQGETIRDARGRTLLNFPLAYPETLASSSAYPAPIRKIALLLNAPSLNGIYFSRHATYMSELKRMLAWGRRNNVAFSIRCKPSYSFVSLIAAETGVDGAQLLSDLQMPMAQYLQDCDLCLMFDAPTSGAVEFLAKSVPIINPLPRHLSKSEVTFISARVVPRESVSDTLARLDGFMADLNSFFLFRNQQFRSYVDLFARAQPLRVYL